MSKEEKTKEKKTSDKSKKKKQNRIVKWFKDLKTEFKKVVWPSKKKVRKQSLRTKNANPNCCYTN